jgi:hypothetical protein
MPQATGLNSIQPVFQDRDSILIGSVRAGEGSSAETRTGAKRILQYKLNTASGIKIVASGGQSSSAGGYIVKVAHIPRDGDLTAANPTAFVTLGSIVFDGKEPTEIGFTGAQVEKAVKKAASPAITGDVRVTAIWLDPGTGTGAGGNGIPAPTGTGNVVHLQMI